MLSILLLPYDFWIVIHIHRLSNTHYPGCNCDSSCTCKLGTLFVSVKYVLVSVKLVCV
jgi:hypothetical protein